MEWLIFIFIANMVTGFVMNAQTADGSYVVAGVDYIQAANTTGNLTQYEEVFNATELVEDLKPTTEALDYVIATFTAVFNFVDKVSWIWDGFSQMVLYWGSFIPSEGAYNTFNLLADILRAVSLFMLVTLILEFTRGVAILP